MRSWAAISSAVYTCGVALALGAVETNGVTLTTGVGVGVGVARGVTDTDGADAGMAAERVGEEAHPASPPLIHERRPTAPRHRRHISTTVTASNRHATYPQRAFTLTASQRCLQMSHHAGITEGIRLHALKIQELGDAFVV